MKNCPHCDQPIQPEALKCHYCQRWLVDTSKLENKKSIVPWIILIIIVGGMYHTLVVKAMRNEQARQCYIFVWGSPEYEICKGKISYQKTFFNFREIIQAWD